MALLMGDDTMPADELVAKSSAPMVLTYTSWDILG